MNLIQKLKGEMETDRLLLRRWTFSDFNAFLKFDADPQVMPKAGAKPADNLEEAEAHFHKALRDAGCYAIVLKKTGEPIGKIKFQRDFRRPQVNSLSVGYELRQEGYMTEALRAMVVCAFERKRVDVLAVSHFTVNDRSRRVIEKCGFRREGVILRAYRRYDGEIFDDECYSILREEFLENRDRYPGGKRKDLPPPSRQSAKTPDT